ncbi:hypothetical protein BDV18DRAFT_166669 [Aspergillus unguis]
MDRLKELRQVGRRLLPNYIDAMAVDNPRKLAFIQAVSLHPPARFDITYQDLSNLINRLAWWLAESLHGKARDLLLLSPRNSVPIHKHLIKVTGASAIIYDTLFSAAATELTTLQNIHASSEAFVMFHTSGSTGMPKPVTSVHAAVAASDNLRRLYSEKTHRVSKHRVLESASSIYNGCPLFHAAGVDGVNYMLLGGTVVILGPPNQPSSPQMFRDILHMTKVEGVMLPPLLIDHIAEEPTLVDEVSKLKFVAYGGGPASQKAGDLLSLNVLILNMCGSSECCIFGNYVTEPENWEWFHYAPEMGISWEPVDGDDNSSDLYEMIIRRGDFPQKQAIFANFPELDEWHTKDIYRRHPRIPYYYKYHSRKDDVIVFSTGEKTNPIDVEAHISSLPGINASMVVGLKRPYPILLIELAASACLDSILPAIHQALEEVNEWSMKYAQIHRGDILLASPDKPFARTAKGNISRNQTNKLYEAEIQAHYDSAEAPDQEFHMQLDRSTDEALATSIADMVGSLTGVKDLGVEVDFFASGLDSRQVQMLAAALFRDFDGKKDIQFLRNAVYMNPTARGLVDHIHSNTEDVADTFDSLFQKYSSMLPQPPKPPTVLNKNHHVLVTGTTGFVGSFILQTLLQRPDVTEITCINRRIPDVKLDATVVNYLQGDLSRPLFNLSEKEYRRLSTVTEVIHCQWPVTFNLPLALFEPQIAGIANLVQMAYDSPTNPRIVFISSIATIQADDSLEYAQGGYGQSKLLASRLLDHAAVASGVQSAVCRVGQVSGPVKGAGVWPERDWFPTLLKASKTMGVLPKSLGRFDGVDWLPVDFLSEALVALALDGEDGESGRATSRVEYFHFVNPSVSSYADLVPIILRRLRNSRDIELVDTLAEWNERLASWTPAGEISEDLSMMAAKALLEFYQSLADLNQPTVVLDTSLTVEKLPSLKDAGAVNEQWMELWLDQWDFE